MKKAHAVLTAILTALLLASISYVKTPLAGEAKIAAAPTGVELPRDYRHWTIIAASHRTDKGEIRLILGNDIAIEAYEKGTLPFPDGAIIAKLAYKAVKLESWESAIVPGKPARQEFMVKDSKKYADTGGWGFGRFVNGKPVTDPEVYASCFPCHRARASSQDFVFTRYAP